MPAPSSSQNSGPLALALARLLARSTLLIILALLLVLLIATRQLGPGPALLVFFVMGIAALLLPGGAVRIEPALPVLPVPEGGRREVSAFANALADPCIVLDRRTVVVHVNPAAQRQYPRVLPGNPITFSMRSPDLVQAIEGANRTGTTRTVELHETLPAETWDKVVVAPLTLGDREWFADEERLLVVTIQSLTELKRVDALRSDFIANASHELRTPLASLLGFIDTLLGPAAKDSAARERFLNIMRGQAERMSKLIDDLLSLSRIEMHQHVRPTGTIELGGLLREVCDGLQIQAKAAELAIVMDVPERAANTIGDRGQLYEVFENLVDNAIKYGARGKTVELSLVPANRPGFQHMVSVIDHGPGVEPEHVPRLTERFYRIDADTSRKKKGTGLGLAIVKHIVQRHRGTLTIRSKPGEGMRVDVFLP